MDTNVLYYGDNLDVLRRHIKDETRLNLPRPTLQQQRRLQVCSPSRTGHKPQPRLKHSKTHGNGTQPPQRTYQEVVETGGKVSQTLQALRMMLGDSNMLAYLAMMAPRLVELRRVMKPTSSIYLHCDPTASHYSKLLMDAVFGPEHFRNEIIWNALVLILARKDGAPFTILSCAIPRLMPSSGTPLPSL